MTEKQRRIGIVAFFLLVLVVDWFLYFRHAAHFFQADTIFLLNHRASSLSGYLKEFVSLNPSGWYRPLANELIESLLYPVTGLHPIPYRIPVYIVFFVITIGVYALGFAVTQRHLAAGIAAFFFTVHTANAYTTYDIGFMPELLYTFFFIGATLAYLRFVQSGDKRAYALSLFCLIGGLFSKEAAVMMPAGLFVTGILFGAVTLPFRKRVIWSIRSIAPHVLICVVYFAFVVGYLHVVTLSVGKLFDQSQTPAPGDYVPVFNRGFFTNAGLALTWAFNIPREWWTQWQRPNPAMLGYLQFFRVLVIALAVAGLFRHERKVIVFGFFWFWIAIFPALPLVAHFVPYYLFLPVAGLSLVVGTGFMWLYDVLSHIRMPVAAATIGVLLAGVLYVTSRSIRNDIADNRLLGGSAQIAQNTLQDLTRLYPSLPSGTTLYFADGRENLAWEHDSGGLIKMAYGADTVSVRYQSQGYSVAFGDPNMLVFRVRNGRLSDETQQYRVTPADFLTFVNSDLRLDLSAAEVAAGDKYALTIKGASNMPVRVAYTLNDGPLETFSVMLDAGANAVFDVSPQTRKGTYKFWAFSVSTANEWIRADQTLAVR